MEKKRDHPRLLDYGAELWTESHLKALRQTVQKRIPQIKVPANATLNDLTILVTDAVGYRVFSTPQDVESVLDANFGCPVDPDRV